MDGWIVKLETVNGYPVYVLLYDIILRYVIVKPILTLIFFLLIFPCRPYTYTSNQKTH